MRSWVYRVVVSSEEEDSDFYQVDSVLEAVALLHRSPDVGLGREHRQGPTEEVYVEELV